MTRLVASVSMVAMVCTVGEVRTAFAQAAAFSGRVAAVQSGELHGTVTDDRDRPIAGVIVSAVGVTSAFALTDAAGRYGLGSLPSGPYLLRAHSQGYTPARSTLIQVNSGARATLAIRLARRGAPSVLAAGVGTSGDAAQAEDDSARDEPTNEDDHSELAWRLRHLKRGVLKETQTSLARVGDEDSLLEDSLETVARAMVSASARVASAMFSDVPLTGQINLLTTTSFGRPQRLFEPGDGMPHGVAYVSLVSPGTTGNWALRGALTQGDLSSWVLAGAYAKHAEATHAYEAGVSYTMQRYVGGNAAALAAVADGSRNAGTVFAYDTWRVAPALTLTYGAKYARYGYLEGADLLSPRVAVTVDATDWLRIRAAASRHAIAPGAEEFQPPSAIGLWLPPERTFSTLPSGRPFTPERVAHYEVAAEHDAPGGVTVGARAFRQRVDDQVVTLFGVTVPHSAASEIGHYYVASAGDVRTQGWSVSVGRAILGTVRGAVDYTDARADWDNRSPELDLLLKVAGPIARADRERLRDVTSTVDAEVPATATRMFVMYRVNTSDAIDRPGTTTGTRFDVQIHQRLPFLNFTNAQWAMLIAIRNVFHEDALDRSAYDELLVVRPPKRIVGGVTVRF